MPRRVLARQVPDGRLACLTGSVRLGSLPYFSAFIAHSSKRLSCRTRSRSTSSGFFSSGDYPKAWQSRPHPREGPVDRPRRGPQPPAVRASRRAGPGRMAENKPVHFSKAVLSATQPPLRAHAGVARRKLRQS